MKKRGSKKKFSLENAVFLCEEVQRLEKATETEADPDEFVEDLRELVEVVVWGDKNEEAVFDIFLERSVMNTFRDAILNAMFSSCVKVQIIQCVTILLQNLTRRSSIYYVCSNNHINKIICMDFDEHDEELLSNYVSFLKTLSLRLNEDSLQFFFDKQQKVFPLFTQAIKLLHSDDRMVKTSARQIVISLLQLREPQLVEFLNEVHGEVCTILVDLIVRQLFAINNQLLDRDEFVSAKPATFASPGLLDTEVEDLIDDLFYLNDCFDVPLDAFPATLASTLENSLVRPILIPSLSVATASESTPVQEQRSAPKHDDPENDVERTSAPGNSSLVEHPRTSSLFSSGSKDSLTKASQRRRPHRQTLITPLAYLFVGSWIKVNTARNIHQRLIEMLFTLQTETLLLDAESTALVALRSPRAQRSFPQIIFAIQNVVQSRLSSDAVKTALVGDAKHDSVYPRSLCLPDRWATADLANISEHYNASIEGGSHSVLSLERPSFPDVLRAHPLAHSLLEALAIQVGRKELCRLAVFLYGLNALFQFAQSVPPESLRQSMVALLKLAQVNLHHRVERYRQHLWMLYNGSGANSVLTPSSFLCQLLEDDGGVGAGEITDPVEPLFIRLERDYAQILSCAVAGSDRLGKDVVMLFPLLPCLACWNSELVPEVDGDVVHGDAMIDEYLKFQTKSNAQMPLSRRSAQDEAEIEFVEIALWCLIRQKIFTQFYSRPDPLPNFIRLFQPTRGDNQTVSVREILQETGSMGIRCEYTPEANELLPGNPAPGTVMFFFLHGAEVFFIEPSRDVADKGRVAFSLQALYTEAIVNSKLLFKITLVQNSPNHRTKVCVTFRERHECQSVAQSVQQASRCMKKQAGALVTALITADVGDAPAS